MCQRAGWSVALRKPQAVRSSSALTIGGFLAVSSPEADSPRPSPAWSSSSRFQGGPRRKQFFQGPHKGGSEPGVLSLPIARIGNHGIRFCFSAPPNRRDAQLDSTAVLAAFQGVLAALGGRGAAEPRGTPGIQGLQSPRQHGALVPCRLGHQDVAAVHPVDGLHVADTAGRYRRPMVQNVSRNAARAVRIDALTGDVGASCHPVRTSVA